jgi:ubiquinone/menaquinone biosynthesis C-methylase UbiE
MKENENKFEVFFSSKNYQKIKNSFYHYRYRKKEIKTAFFKFFPHNNSLKLLDIGSGISSVSPFPKETLHIDYAKDAVSLMKKLGYSAKYGDIINLKEKTSTFDCIFCSEVLEHVKEYKKAILELNRILKKNGKLIITVPVHEKYWNVDDKIVGHYRRFNIEELKKDLKKSRFKILIEKPIGSYLDRILTTFAVKFFDQSNSNKPLNSFKAYLIILANSFIYLLIRASLVFTSKNTTSVMLYVCEKE